MYIQCFGDSRSSKKNEMQVLDVDVGGGPTGNHSVAMQSLSDHGKSEAFMKIRAEITFLS